MNSIFEAEEMFFSSVFCRRRYRLAERDRLYEIFLST